MSSETTKQAVRPRQQCSNYIKTATQQIKKNRKTDREEILLWVAELSLQLQKCVTVSLWSGKCVVTAESCAHRSHSNLILFLTYLICLACSALTLAPYFFHPPYSSLLISFFLFCYPSIYCAEAHTDVHTHTVSLFLSFDYAESVNVCMQMR